MFSSPLRFQCLSVQIRPENQVVNSKGSLWPVKEEHDHGRRGCRLLREVPRTPSDERASRNRRETCRREAVVLQDSSTECTWADSHVTPLGVCVGEREGECRRRAFLWSAAWNWCKSSEGASWAYKWFGWWLHEENTSKLGLHKD